MKRTRIPSLVPQLARNILVEIVSAEHGRLRLPPLSEADPAAWLRGEGLTISQVRGRPAQQADFTKQREFAAKEPLTRL